MPVPSTAITRVELGATFQEFDLAADRLGFIGPRVLRPRLVAQQSASIGKIPLKQLLSEPPGGTKRASGAPYQTGGVTTFDKFSYATEDHGVDEPLDDREASMYRDLVDGEKTTADRAIDRVLRGFERAVAAKIYDTAVWTGASLTGALTNEWDDSANATPLDDISTYREKVVTNSGLEPNALILNRRQFRGLINCDQIKESVKYTQVPTPGMMANMLADLLDLRFIIVAGGLTNSANPGKDASIERIWSSEYAMLCRVAETDDPREPCIGRTFIWTGNGVSAPGTDQELAVVMREYRGENPPATHYQPRCEYDPEIMYAQAGFLISNVLTL